VLKTTVVVEDIMSRNMVTANVSETAIVALKRMLNRRVENIVVIKNKKPVGILSKNDFLIKVLSKGIDPKIIKVSDIMSKPIIITPDYDIASAASLMSKRDSDYLLVVDKGVMGIVTSKDILRHLKKYIEAMVRSVLFE
jgi:CBS domain-containing protein